MSVLLSRNGEGIAGSVTDRHSYKARDQMGEGKQNLDLKLGGSVRK